jgi:beta-lactamase class D
MKKLILFFVLGLCASNSSMAEIKCFVAKEAGKIIAQEGKCSERHSPCSTFKIPLSLMGFDSGILKDENTPKWEFTKENGKFLSGMMEQWKGFHTPKSWISNSVVWYSQVLTQKLGKEKFKSYVEKLSYGNQDISGDKDKNNGLTNSWLTSSLQISPEEQIAFLEKLIASELPVSKESQKLTRNILFVEELSDGWNLYGKTGAGNQLNAEDGSTNIGWFIGWLEKKGRRIVFAHYIEGNEGGLGKVAKEMAKEKLLELVKKEDVNSN